MLEQSRREMVSIEITREMFRRAKWQGLLTDHFPSDAENIICRDVLSKYDLANNAGDFVKA